MKVLIHRIVHNRLSMILPTALFLAFCLLMPFTGQAAEKAAEKAAGKTAGKTAGKITETLQTEYTLAQLIGQIKDNNLLLKVSHLDKKIAKEEYRMARTLPNPELELVRKSVEITGAPEKTTLWSVGGKISIPNPIQRYHFLKSIRKDIAAAGIESDITKHEVVKSLKHHFYTLQFLEKLKTFGDEKLKRLGAVNKITKAKVSIGEAKEIDYLRSSVEMQKNKTHLFSVEKKISFQKSKVHELLNYTLPTNFTISGDFSFTPLAPIEGNIPSLVKKSPYVKLKANRLEREKANHKAEKYSIIEGFEIFAEREKEMEGKIWKVGIGVSIPLFNQKTAATRKAKYEKEKARLEYDHEEKHFLVDIQRMVSDIRVLEKEIETFKGAILKEGRENLELSEKLYKLGEIPLVVFLDAQNSFFEIMERYYQAITEWRFLKAELEALLGEDL